MIKITNSVSVDDSEIEIQAIRAQGAGGQNVNKVSTAIHLRFDVRASSLPEVYKQRLLDRKDHRITQDGIIIIKAQRFRSQEKNRADALLRLQALIQSAIIVDKKRIATRPSKNARKRRVEEKSKRGQLKGLRGKVNIE